jgi:CubicO group peptidase (beta-lactamase class C family)
MSYRLNPFVSRFVLMALLFGAASSAFGAFDNTRLEAVAEEGMAQWHVPGLALAVVNKDALELQRGFGRTAVNGGQPVDEHTLFAIASTTKAMVVSGILMLVDEKKLSLDDPVIKYLPELHFSDPMLTEQLMVRDLLAHRTGLPSTDFWSFFQGMPLEEQIRQLHNVPPLAPLRTRLIYQNTMFDLAGLIIERVSGKPWNEFVTERLWQPIGMRETFASRGRIDAGHATVTPYYYQDKKLTVADWDIDADIADAAGSVWSSIHDMSLWAQFLLRGGVTADGKQLISKESVEEMFTPQQLSSPADFYPTTALTKPHWRSYGLAWFQQDFEGRMINFHTGSLGGLIAIIGLDRDNDRAVIVLGNRDHAEMRHALLWEAMDTSSGPDRRDWNKDILALYENAANERDAKWKETEGKRLSKTRLSLPVAAYAGTFRSPITGDVTIQKTREGFSLHMRKVDMSMTHWHLDTFLVEKKSWEMREFLTFHVDAAGQASSFELFGETFRREPPAE